MTSKPTDTPVADKVETHRDLSMLHARTAQNALHDLQQLDSGGNRHSVLNQVIGVNLKLADVHARLAVAVSQSATVGAVNVTSNVTGDPLEFAQRVAKSLSDMQRAMGRPS